MMENDWRKKHGIVIEKFLEYLNKKSDDYILKDSTSLMICYGLDRFSEDIDLDSLNHGVIGKVINKFCKENNYIYRIGKDTDTTQRYFVNYGNQQKPLKIEISYRKKLIDKKDSTQVINGIRVYKINDIFMMKLNAYIVRGKIRDLYDIIFISKKYWNELLPISKDTLSNALQYKGLEHCDYIIREQCDELINNDKLAEDFLNIYDKLGLLAEKDERDLLENKIRKGD